MQLTPMKPSEVLVAHEALEVALAFLDKALDYALEDISDARRESHEEARKAFLLLRDVSNATANVREAQALVGRIEAAQPWA